MKDYVKNFTRPNWIEVDLDAIANNFNKLREMVGANIKIMPAVKSNAYGHGILESARVLEECGADVMGIGSVDEGIALRKYGIKTPLLIFASNLIEGVAGTYTEYNLIPTIMYEFQGKAISDAAVVAGKKDFPIFIKVECGRGRLGINVEDAPPVIEKIVNMPSIKLCGIYTHLCDTKWEDQGANDYTRWQNERFSKMLDVLKSKGIHPPFIQIANTAASIAMHEIWHQGICPGRAIWGYSPLDPRDEHPKLQQAMVAWKTRVILTKDVIGGKFGPGFKNVKLGKPLHIGIIPCGLNDGVDHKNSAGYVLIRGKRIPVGSTESLEHTILDLSDAPEVEVGDEVVIFGKQGNQEITYKEVSKLWDRNLSEWLIGINPNLPRVYFRNGKAVSIANGFNITKL